MSAAMSAAAPDRGGRDLLLLAILGALLFLPGLGRHDVWNPDEARYAEVAREMPLLGQWAVPHLNGQVYSQKPPLLFWSIALFGRLTGGLDATAARLPSALAAIGSLLLVYAIGRRVFGRRAAWIAAAAFATCFKVIWQGRFGQIDMLLTGLVTLGVWFWVRGYTERRPELNYFFFLAAGLATLAKGPVGLLPPLLSILAFLAVTRDREELKRLRIGRGLLLWALVVLAWLVPAGLDAGPDYLRQIVFRQNVTRYANPWHHFAPPWYYLGILPGEFFPWSFLLPVAIVAGWKRLVRPDGIRSDATQPTAILEESSRALDRLVGERARAGFLFCLCWAVVTLVFFSISPAKRSVYILTMYPALALLVGAGLDLAAAARPRWRRGVVFPLGGIAGLVLLVIAALPIAARKRPETVILGGDAFVYGLMAVLLPLLLGAIAAWWLSRTSVTRAVGALAVGMALTGLSVAFYALPRFDVFKSARGLSSVLVSRMAPGEPYGIYPRLDSTFLFQTRRFCEELDSEAKLRTYLARPGRVWLLAQKDDFSHLANLPPLVEVARDAEPREGYILFLKP
jgi:4-amino-4-deoxy-L-arabinose transferase-like glycosyltransferase